MKNREHDDHDDDLPDPLAGIDLGAWQPPAPPAAQVDAILARVREGTRTDVASAVEVEPVRRTDTRAALGPVRRRTRWVAVGAVALAAAAVLVLVVWPRSPSEPAPDRTVTTPTPVPGGSGDHAAATVAAALPECRGYLDRHDWVHALECGKALDVRFPGNPAVVALVDAAAREGQSSNNLRDLKAAAKARDYVLARSLVETIGPDSMYTLQAAAVHAAMLDALVADEVAGAKALAKRGECAAIEARAEQLRAIHAGASDAVLAVSCKAAGSSSSCDPDALLERAREAGAASQWAKAQRLAEGSNRCRPDKAARQLAALSSCELGNARVAATYTGEAATKRMQVCAPAGTQPASPPPKCDAVALLAEARSAGGANQWERVLAKAEASNRCMSNKSARQLALLAACNLHDRHKALAYWDEFQDNVGMQQRCAGVVK